MGEFSGLFHREPLGCAFLLPLLGALLPGALVFLACKIAQELKPCRISTEASKMTHSLLQVILSG